MLLSYGPSCRQADKPSRRRRHNSRVNRHGLILGCVIAASRAMA
jgi:hypothetical protein